MRLPRKTLLLTVLVLAVLALVLGLALREQSAPVTVTLLRYEKQPPHAGKVAELRLSNHTGARIWGMLRSMEVKSSQGWTKVDDTKNYRHAVLDPKASLVITLPAPASNRIWRANFLFEVMRDRPRWVNRLRAALPIKGLKPSEEIYEITTEDIGN